MISLIRLPAFLLEYSSERKKHIRCRCQMGKKFQWFLIVESIISDHYTPHPHYRYFQEALNQGMQCRPSCTNGSPPCPCQVELEVVVMMVWDHHVVQLHGMPLEVVDSLMKAAQWMDASSIGQGRALKSLLLNIKISPGGVGAVAQWQSDCLALWCTGLEP